MTDLQLPSFDQERRQHPRILFKDPLLFSPVMESTSGHVLEVAAACFAAKSLDLSEGGICLEILESVPQPNILLIHMKVPLKPPVALMIYAKKIWEKGAIGGFQFIVISGEDRSAIRRYIESTFSQIN